MQLPVVDLAERFMDKDVNLFQKNFILIYLDSAFHRTTLELKVKVLSNILPYISSMTSNHRDTILGMYLRIADKLQSNFDIIGNDNKDLLLGFILNVLLYPCQKPKDLTTPIYGLSRDARKVIEKNLNYTMQEFADKKIGMLKLLTAHPSLEVKDYYLHLIVASCDGVTDVSETADQLLRRISNYAIEDMLTLSKIYELYLGSSTHSNTQDMVPPVDKNLKSRLILCLMKSRLASNDRTTLEIINETLFSDYSPALRILTMGLIQWVIRTADKDFIDSVGPEMFGYLIKLQELTKQKAESQLKSSLYQCLASLCRKCPTLFSNNVQLVKELFDSLLHDDSSIKPSIQEALTSLCFALQDASHDILDSILDYLLEISKERDDPHSILTAIYYSIHLYPFNNPIARYINLLSLKNPSSQVVVEARKGLSPYKIDQSDVVMDPSKPYPKFGEMIAIITKDFFERRSWFNDIIYKEILVYMTELLEHSIDNEDISNDKCGLNNYVRLIDESLVRSSSYDLIHTSMSSLFLLFKSYPEKLSLEYRGKESLLVPLLVGGSINETKRIASRLLSIIIVDKENQETVFPVKLKDLKNMKPNHRAEAIGHIYLLGFIIAQAYISGTPISKENTIEAITLFVNTIKECARSLPDLIVACIESLGYACRYVPWSEIMPNQTILEELIQHLFKLQDFRITEASAYAVASISLRDRSICTNSSLLNILFGSHELKKEELHFSIGEALSTIAFSWRSKSSKLSWIPIYVSKENEIQSEDIKTHNGYLDDSLSLILSTILKSYLLNDKPTKRVSASIWTLCILKDCKDHPDIDKYSQTIQDSLIQLLSDSNDIVQEVSSKGLVLLHERGDERIKKALVENLVQVLQKGNAGFKVTDSSSIQLGSEDSDKITTYKELCDLATDMNKPELIYRFMEVSTHHSLWNSQKGAAFAAKDLLEQGDYDIQDHLAGVVPKLFRSSYDPNKSIATSMARIYNAIVDSRKASTKYFDPIMSDLLENMTNKAWRNREASCNALADIISGKSFEAIEKYYEDLWTLCFKVLDDIKSSVRKSAENLCKSLSQLTLRFCDPKFTNFENGKRALTFAIPFMLDKGIVSSVKEVQYIAIDLILQISKVASFLLKPHIPKLVETLIESASGLESQELNYLEQHAERMGISKDLIDEARVKLSTMSPFTEILDFCARQVDSQNIKDLKDGLVNALTKSSATTSRVSAAQFIMHLSLIRKEECKSIAPKIMQALRTGVFHKSKEVRVAYASAIGRWSLVSSTKTISITAKYLINQYKESEVDDMSTRQASALVLLEIMKYASQKIQPVYVDIIPTVFFACQDPNQDIADLFKKIWGESSASLGLYVDNIITLLEETFDSGNWNLKKQGAQSISRLFETLSSTDVITFAPKIVNILVVALKGRTWTGKEALLDSISKVVQTCRSIWINEATKPLLKCSERDIVLMVFKECLKDQEEYKKQAIISLTSLLQTFDINCYEDMKDGLMKIASYQGEESKETKNQSSIQLSIRSNAYLALGESFPSDVETQKLFLKDLLEFFKASLLTDKFNLKISILQAIKSLLKKINPDSNSFDNETLGIMLDMLYDNMIDVNFSSIRSLSCTVLEDLLLKTKEMHHLRSLIPSIKSKLLIVNVQSNSNPAVQKVLETLDSV